MTIPQVMNPFLKTRLDNAFDKPKDVLSIQGMVFEDILTTLQEISSSKISIANVLLGTAGSGKTHLLTRLWQYSLKPDAMFLFVSIPPPGDIEKIYTHIFREFIGSLLQKLDHATISPLELLITEIMKTVLLEKLPSSEQDLRIRIEQQSQNLHKLLQTQFRERISNHVLVYIPEVYPQIDIILVKTLLAVYSDLKNSAIHFLQGGIVTEKERIALGLPVSQLTEEISNRWLLNILKITPVVILLAADQLESTYYRFKIAGLRKFLDIFFGLLESPKLLFLMVGQSKEWQNYRSQIAKYQLDRINKISYLQPVSPDQMRLLIKSRLEDFQISIAITTVEERQHPYYPFSEILIDKVIQYGQGNPRKVLNMLREAFTLGLKSGWSPHFENQWLSSFSFDYNETITESKNVSAYTRLKNLLLPKIEEKRYEVLNNIENIPLATKIESVKGVLSQILYQIGLVLQKNDEKIDIATNILLANSNIRIDVLMSKKTSSQISHTGVIFLYAVEISNYLGTLQRLYTEITADIPYFSRLILVHFDQTGIQLTSTLTIQEYIQKFNNNPRSIFITLSSEEEISWLIWKAIIDEAADIELPFHDFNTSQLIPWFLIAEIGSKNQLLNTGIFSYQELLYISDIFKQRLIHLLFEADANSYIDSINTLTDDINTQDWIFIENKELLQAITLNYGKNSSDNSLILPELFLVLIIAADEIKWVFFQVNPLQRLSKIGKILLANTKPDSDFYSWFLMTLYGRTLTSLDRLTLKDYLDLYGRCLILTNNPKLEKTYEGVFSALKDFLYIKLEEYRPTTSTRDAETYLLDQLALDFSIDKSLFKLLLQFYKEDLGIVLRETFIDIYTIPQKILINNKEIEYQPAILRLSTKDLQTKDMNEGNLLEAELKTHEQFAEGVILSTQDSEYLVTNTLVKGEEGISHDPAEEASKEMIAWLGRIGRTFPPDQEPLLQAIFRKISFTKEDIAQFGLKLFSLKNQLQKVTIFDIANTIIKSKDPYKKDWEKLDVLPTNIRAITRRFLTINFIIESLLTVDFNKQNMANFWHEITYSILTEYLTLTETIRTLSIFYWEKFFVKDFYRDVTPLINYYHDTFKQKLKKALEDPKDKNHSELFRTYAGYVVQIWTIIDRYNNVTIEQYQIPEHWVFETLYKEIVPRVEGDLSFFTKLTPVILMKFFTKSYEIPNIFSEQEKDQIIRTVQHEFTKKASQEFYSIALEQLKAHQIIQSIFSTSWSLYYLNIAKDVSIERFVELKQKWAEYYLLLLKNTFPEELLLLHLSFVFKSLKSDNLAIKLKTFILETTTLTEIDPKTLTLPEQKQDLQDIEQALRHLEPQIKDIKIVLETYLPMWQPIVQRSSTKLGHLSKELFQYALQVTENFSDNIENIENPPIMFSTEKGKIPFIDSVQGRLAVLAPLDSVTKHIVLIIEGLGMKNSGDIQKRRRGVQKGIETKFRGIIAGTTLELTYILMTYDGQQCAVDWTLKWTWTPLSNDQLMDKFVPWITLFHQIILRDLVRELKITRKEQQICANCNEWLEVKHKDASDITVCQKCRYPNLVLKHQL